MKCNKIQTKRLLGY